jgi:IMP cyclohydrolase
LKLADGIALAEVTEEGFANICCDAIAQGLLTAWYEKDNFPKNRIKYILEELSLAKINLQHPDLI